MNDSFNLYDLPMQSRLLLGTARYSTPEILEKSIEQSGTEIITVSLRRESSASREGQNFWKLVQKMGKHVLPNTAGCYSVKEAITTAHMAREIFQTDWIKLEIIGDSDTLQPDVFGLVEAAKILCNEGFKVFPYTTDDLGVAERLLSAGCCVLMPWGAPIGSGRGLNDVYSLRTMRAHFKNVPLIIDAGIGLPSHAAQAMELGYDAILLNTSVAKSGNPILMASAFAQAIEAGRLAYLSKPIEMLDMAVPSTPVIGKAFL